MVTPQKANDVRSFEKKYLGGLRAMYDQEIKLLETRSKA